MLMKYVLYLASIAALLQNPNANNTVQEPQASEFRALIQKAAKFALQRTELRATTAAEWGTTTVSWVASDKNGLIYLLQRSDKADPVVVLNRNGQIQRTWGKGMYTMPHAIRLDPQGN